MRAEPDWKKLRAANEMLEHGPVTREQWGQAFELASEAVGEHTEFLEGLLMRGAKLGFVRLGS